MTPDIATIRDRAEALCRVLVAGESVYVLLASEFGPDYLHPDVGGFALRNLDLIARDVIGSRWCGRGPAFVVNDVTLLADHDPDHPGDTEHRFLIVALHELAHCLTWRRETDSPPIEAETVTRRRVQLAEINREPAETTTPGLPPWHLHGGDFTRACCHLSHRVARLGWNIPPSALCAGERYGLALASRYAETLGGECETLIHMELRDVLKVDPPTELHRLWSFDQAKHKGERVMSSLSILEAVGERLASLRKQREAEFVSLVRDIGDGVEPDAGDVARILDESGKSLADLTDGVELLAKRKRWAADLHAAKDLEAAENSAKAAITRAESDLEAAQRKCAEIIGPARDVLAQATAARATAREAKKRLLENPLNSEPAQRLDEIRNERQSLSERASANRTEATRLEQLASGTRTAIDQQTGGASSNETLKRFEPELGRVVRWTSEATRLRAEAVELDAEATATEKQERDAAAALLVP